MKKYSLYLLGLIIFAYTISYSIENSSKNETSISKIESSNKANTKINSPAIPFYEIIKTQKSNDFVEKVEYSLSIAEELNKNDLELIANDLIKKQHPSCDYIFISYYLPSQSIGTGNWALTRITNNQMETTINGTPKKDIPQVELTDKTVNIIGKWYNRLVGGEYIIYEKNAKIFFKTSFSDGSGSEEELITKKVRGTIRYYNKESDRQNEYYVISNGTLSIYDDLDNLGARYEAE